MNRLLFVTIVAAAFALCAAATAAPPCCGQTYYAPTYSRATETWPQYSGWEYERLEGDSGLFRRFRFRRDSANGNSIRETDDFAWALLGNGQYEQRGRLADLLGQLKNAGSLLQQLGKSEAGYSKDEYSILKAFPYLSKLGLLQGKGIPGAVDPKDYLAPFSTDKQAQADYASKATLASISSQERVALANADIEREQIRGRNLLALEAQRAQSEERFLAEMKEILAVRNRLATVTADPEEGGGNASKIPVDSPELAKVIADNCFKCHGSDRQDSGLDFRVVDARDGKLWRKIAGQVETGLMPSKGQRLPDDQIELFYEQADKARGK